MAYVALNIKGLPVSSVYMKARTIYDAMWEEQAYFNDMPITFADFEALLKELQTRSSKAIRGSHLDIVERNETMKKTKKVLAQLASYVQMKSEGDAIIILSAGMDVKKTGSYTRKAVNTPIGLTFRMGEPSSMPLLQWQCDRNVMNYIEITQTPDDPESWRRYAFTSKKKLRIKGLLSDHKYWFRVMSITPGAVSDFSVMVKKMIG